MTNNSYVIITSDAGIDKDNFSIDITVTSQWAPWHLKSPASQLFAQIFAQVHIKMSKLSITGLCLGNVPVTG